MEREVSLGRVERGVKGLEARSLLGTTATRVAVRDLPPVACGRNVRRSKDPRRGFDGRSRSPAAWPRKPRARRDVVIETGRRAPRPSGSSGEGFPDRPWLLSAVPSL